MFQAVTRTRLSQADYPTKKQANKPLLRAQYRVRQIVTSFHDIASFALLGGES
jgi:hypothetical protein